MRKLLVLILVLAALWSGYWFVGATAVERGAQAVLDNLRAQGWQVEVADVGTRGFPNRFDTTATGVKLADPLGGFAWTAPFFQVLALSYKPNHVIAALPDSQSFDFPGQTLQVDSTRMRASLVVEPGTALALDRATFVAETASVASTLGWAITLKDARFATRQNGGALVHDVGIAASRIALPKALRDTYDPGGALPEVLEVLRVDATLGFDRAIDRHAFNGGPAPQVERFVLNDAALVWGGVKIAATGTLTIGADRLPVGDITLESAQWREVAQMIADSGMIQPQYVPTLDALFQSMAAADGTPEVLTAPLTFKNGQVSFGFLPLGPAPRF